MTSVKAVAGPAVGPVALLRPEPGRWRLDPRTRLLGLVAVNALVLGNSPFAVTVAGFVLTAVLLATAGVNFIISLPMGDDIMLNYQTNSFHDIATVRQLLNLRPAPEFEQWLERHGIMENGCLTSRAGDASIFF